MDRDSQPDQPVPLHELLGSEPADPGPEELRRIVARADRCRWRVATGAMAVTLLLGGVGGYLVSDRSAPRPVATTRSSAPSAAGANSPGPSTGSPPGSGVSSATEPSIAVPLRLRHLFTRTANGVTIRGFLTPYNQPLPLGAPVPAGCPGVTSGNGVFTAEVSTDRMVATVGHPQQRSLDGPVGPVGVQVVGQREGDQHLVVMVQVGAPVTSVAVRFSDGSRDGMTPVQGWVAVSSDAVAAQSELPSSVGVLTAVGADGKVLVTEAVQLGVAIPGAAAKPGSASPRSASTGSGGVAVPGSAANPGAANSNAANRAAGAPSCAQESGGGQIYGPATGSAG